MFQQANFVTMGMVAFVPLPEIRETVIRAMSNINKVKMAGFVLKQSSPFIEKVIIVQLIFQSKILNEYFKYFFKFEVLFHCKTKKLSYTRKGTYAG